MNLIEEIRKDLKFHSHNDPKHIRIRADIYDKLKKESLKLNRFPIKINNPKCINEIFGLKIIVVQQIITPTGNNIRWEFDGTKYR